MSEGGREVSRIKGWTDRQTEEKEIEQLEGERSKKKKSREWTGGGAERRAEGVDGVGRGGAFGGDSRQWPAMV